MDYLNFFKDGVAIECFKNGEENVKGMLMGFDGKAGEFRLFAPDFPEWIEDNGVGIKLVPDSRTTEIMKKSLRELQNHHFNRSNCAVDKKRRKSTGCCTKQHSGG